MIPSPGIAETFGNPRSSSQVSRSERNVIARQLSVWSCKRERTRERNMATSASNTI